MANRNKERKIETNERYIQTTEKRIIETKQTNTAKKNMNLTVPTVPLAEVLVSGDPLGCNRTSHSRTVPQPSSADWDADEDQSSVGESPHLEVW